MKSLDRIKQVNARRKKKSNVETFAGIPKEQLGEMIFNAMAPLVGDVRKAVIDNFQQSGIGSKTGTLAAQIAKTTVLPTGKKSNQIGMVVRMPAGLEEVYGINPKTGNSRGNIYASMGVKRYGAKKLKSKGPNPSAFSIGDQMDTLQDKFTVNLKEELRAKGVEVK